ncbi:MAG TPA: SlyX family protein [Xanthomonadaceae bacterium]|jgi:SlyX protein|nr:SlyX family protein [Xanthomonadaceae bacterium]
MSTNSALILERMIDLETRIAFIERTLIEMSDALADARMESGRDRARVERALADLGELRGMIPGDQQEEPPPPHY